MYHRFSSLGILSKWCFKTQTSLHLPYLWEPVCLQLQLRRFGIPHPWCSKGSKAGRHVATLPFLPPSANLLSGLTVHLERHFGFQCPTHGMFPHDWYKRWKPISYLVLLLIASLPWHFIDFSNACWVFDRIPATGGLSSPSWIIAENIQIILVVESHLKLGVI